MVVFLELNQVRIYKIEFGLILFLFSVDMFQYFDTNPPGSFVF